MNCPHCGKNDCVTNVIYRAVENYGSNTFHVPCVYCNKMIFIHAVRKVKIMNVTKSPKAHNESDF